MTDSQRLKAALDLYRASLGTVHQGTAYDHLRSVVAEIKAKREAGGGGRGKGVGC